MSRKSAQRRFYYDRVARWLLRGYGVVAFILFLSFTAADIAVILRVASGLVAITSLYVTWFWWGHSIGLEVLGDGIRIGRGLRRRFIAWRDIKSFQVTKRPISPPVRVELTSGELVGTPLVQGRKMFWKGGASADIVSVLNKELDDAQADELRTVGGRA